ncbi:hypothetical protein EXT46_11070 [Pseudoalteromonas sp. CO325X]|uniref:hypothetical protein n=1 Tax=Pseudoalteromonas sp. CO325X TaxID=1777262 RepID=UPI001023C694|nr:hypothetical protein [Pseudoalteromonas sp. CO325X]RZF80552.1 hypothetical protein EXT46_11070 [Pseudoalteromonas sp. CO325X]
MKVYRINCKNDQGDILDFDPYSLYQSLKKYVDTSEAEFMVKIFDLHANNDSIENIWPDVMPIKPLSNDYEKVDIYIQGGFLLLSKKAYEYLYQLLNEYGEFLKINVNGCEMILFNLRVFGQEDLDKCIEDYSKGVRSGYKSFAFIDSDINSKLLFKSKLLNGIGLFCGEEFKKLVTQRKLNGIEFNEIN